MKRPKWNCEVAFRAAAGKQQRPERPVAEVFE
jgi:hypothetical protein